jgi:4-diphosphocytidyl-2-C-methyl-D-erythritol kinase
MTVEAFAPAKVNLTLHVTGRRSDGFHLLESLVVFPDIGDRLSFAPAEDLGLEVRGPMAEGVPTDERNLCLRAARHLSLSKGARITLEKHLPHGAGIGGGSADAAATLRGLSQLWDLPLPEAIKAAELGADVPVCLAAPKAMVMRGIGESLSPAPALPSFSMLLVNPRVETPTGPIFAALAASGSINNPPMPEMPAGFASLVDLTGWLRLTRNDLEQAAADFAPIRALNAAIEAQHGCAFARMSGSGSTCFGLFENTALAEAAAAAIRRSCLDWWIAVGAVS